MSRSLPCLLLLLIKMLGVRRFGAVLRKVKGGCTYLLDPSMTRSWRASLLDPSMT